jgi:hypothetical protein
MLSTIYMIDASAGAHLPPYRTGCEASRFDTGLDEGMYGEEWAAKQTSILPVRRRWDEVERDLRV